MIAYKLSLVASIAALANVAAVEFEEPFRIKAAGKNISVQSPGWACPSLADLDQDGNMDLVVGQYGGGKMMYYKNIGKPGAPAYAEGTWLMSGKRPASVPGIG